MMHSGLVEGARSAVSLIAASFFKERRCGLFARQYETSGV